MEPTESAISRIQMLKEWPMIEKLISFLRAISPRSVRTLEIARVIECRKPQVYCIVKNARKYLSLTSGEAIVNLRGIGYRISAQPRAHLFESVKSSKRSDGHIASEMAHLRRVNRNELTDPGDVEVYVAQQARIRLGEARLALSRDLEPVMNRLLHNAAMASTAREEAKTPWGLLGLDDPDHDRN